MALGAAHCKAERYVIGYVHIVGRHEAFADRAFLHDSLLSLLLQYRRDTKNPLARNSGFLGVRMIVDKSIPQRQKIAKAVQASTQKSSRFDRSAMMPASLL